MPHETEQGDSGEPAGLTDVVVIGGGVAGLATARQLAHLGHSVTVLEERDVFGGFVVGHEVAGIELDAGAESFATRRGTVAALIGDLGLADQVAVPAEAGAWVAWNGGTAPLPAAGVLGIPGVPLADDVRRVVGWSGSLRAYLDRLMPLLRVRKESDLGDIVRRRMGRRVLDRLVTPVVAGVHSADPSVVDVHAVAPGLTQAMTVQGSLSGAVMALREQAPAGSRVQGLVGGMHRLVEALAADCRRYGVELRTGVTVTSAERGTDEGWAVHAVDTAAGTPEMVAARAVVVATGFRPALALLSELAARRSEVPAGPGPTIPAAAEWPGSASVTLATLVVDEPRLDAAPRGTGVLVAEGIPGVAAKALTHATAKWAWLAAGLPPHRHVLRLSYGRRGETDARTTDPTRAEVLSDASALLGVPLGEAEVRGFSIVHWNDSPAFATVGHRDRVRRTLEVVDGIAGLDVVGAWVSGTGLAATVEHARTTGSGLAAELRGQRRLDRG